VRATCGKGESMKAHFALKLSVGCACRSGAAALALMIGIASLAGDLDAQQAPGKKGEPAPTAAPPAGPQSSWVKLCDKATAAVKDKNGEEEKKDRNICLTHHERLDGNTGMVLVSAAGRLNRQRTRRGRCFFAQYLPSTPSQHAPGPNSTLSRNVTVCVCSLLISKLNGPAGGVPPVVPLKRSPAKLT
jgi:hypothetical protein